MVGRRSKNFFSYFISETLNFFYMDFFRKCSMFPRTTPLRTNGKRAKGIKAKSIDSFLKSASVLLKFFMN